MAYELRRLSFGEIIGKGFTLYLNNFLPLMIISLIIMLPFSVFEYFIVLPFSSARMLSGYDSEYLSGILVMYAGIFSQSYLNFLAQSITGGAVFLMLSTRYLNMPWKIGEYTSSFFKRFIPLVLLSILLSVMVFLGYIFLVFPGIILNLAFMVSAESCIMEKKSVFGSLRRSWELTKHKKGYLFGLVMLTSLIQGGVMMIFYIPMYIIMAYFTMQQSSNPTEYLYLIEQLQFFYTKSVTMLLQPYSITVSLLVYFNLRMEKEGFELEHLVDQFTMSSSKKDDDFSLPQATN